MININEESYLHNVIASYSPILSNISLDELAHFIVKTIIPLYHNKSVIVTLTAGPASGKTTITKGLLQLLSKNNHPSDVIITEDYNTTNRVERDARIRHGEKPDALKDFAKLLEDVENIKKGVSVSLPLYDPLSGSALDRNISPHIIQQNLHFLFIEGDFQPLTNPDYRIYYYVPSKIRKVNRIKRDVRDRSGGSNDLVAKSFDERQKQFFAYTLPHLGKADMVICLSDKIVNDESYRYDIYLKKSSS